MASVSCNSSHAALYESSQEVGHTLEIKLPKKPGTINCFCFFVFCVWSFCCCFFDRSLCRENLYLFRYLFETVNSENDFLLVNLIDHSKDYIPKEKTMIKSL